MSKKASRKDKSYIRSFGYHSVNLLETTVDKLKAEFQNFQNEVGNVYGNPLFSDYVELLINLYINRKNLPRLMMVSRGPNRIVMYDTEMQVPVAVSVDNGGNVSCTRVQSLDQYIKFAKQYNADMFKAQQTVKKKKGESDVKTRTA
jgi:hypothetical protein